MAKGSYTVVGGTLGVSAPNAKIINLPFQPDFVQLINYTQMGTPANHGVPFATWDKSVVSLTKSATVYPYPTMIQRFNATPVLTTDLISANGISTFSAGQLLQFGAVQQVVASTKGATTSFQVTGHGYAVGDVVLFEGLWQSATTGMPQMAGLPFLVTTVTDANNFIVTWNSNDATYTNLSGSPAGAKVMKVLYPYLYLPGVTFINAITTGSTTTVTTTTNHNMVVGQEVAFRIPTLWGTTQLNSLPNVNLPGSPVYGYVVSVTNNTTLVVNINSTGYTAFTTYIAVSNVAGLTPPQMVAVGDVNTGGTLISAGSPLYPSPEFPTSTNRISTINGPAIRGAYVNNTSQGFVVGAGAAVTDTSAWLGGADGDIMEWRAYLHDITMP